MADLGEDLWCDGHELPRRVPEVEWLFYHIWVEALLLVLQLFQLECACNDIEVIRTTFKSFCSESEQLVT